MNVYEVAVNRRTIRRFKQDKIPTEVLEKMINEARLAPSGSNLQPCEYVIVTDPGKVERLFPCFKWATYIAPSGDPPEGERPTAYIVVLLNREVRETGGTHDAAAAIENILLVAYEEGIGSCWLGSVDREKVKMILSISANCEVDSVVALGYPNEHPVLEETRGPTNYWKDGKGVLHVPKRRLKDVIHLNGYKARA